MKKYLKIIAICAISLCCTSGLKAQYLQIASQLAKRRSIERMSAQAVGGAVGHNPISILVPCHRVIGSDGSMTGYGGGIEKKIGLLELERANVNEILTGEQRGRLRS